jgi:hypothetical protein
MMEKKYVNEEREFMEFIDAESADPPIAVSEKIHKAVARDLMPMTWKVLLKFGMIQSAVAFITLLVCPQFELDLGLIRHDDAHLKALFGELGYMALCGAIFLSSGAVLAAVLLRAEELRAIKRIEYLYLFLASAIALMIFWQLGMPTALASYAAWFIGAFGGSILGFAMIKRLRLAGHNISPTKV